MSSTQVWSLLELVPWLAGRNIRLGRLATALGSVTVGTLLAIEPAEALDKPVATVTSSFPASAVVQYDVIGGGDCSGVLITPEWVLLIAHCVNRYSDRTVSNRRDVYLPPFPDGTRPVVRFRDHRGRETEVLSAVNRIVRVDGASTNTNSLVLLHLSHPAPPWAEPIPLYRGGPPSPDEPIEIWGFGEGSRNRGVGRVKIDDHHWQDAQKFWELCLKAAPSRIRPGDSGGPLLITNNNRKEVLGVNLSEFCGGCSGTNPCGGRAAATFSISRGGHNNPVTLLLDRILTNSAGHGSQSLDINRNGTNEIVLYDGHSGELRLLGIGAERRFIVLLEDQLPRGFQILVVGDFDGSGVKNQMALYRGDTGELRLYRFEYRPDANYFLVPQERYPTFGNSLLASLPSTYSPFGATAAVAGDFDAHGEAKLALIDRDKARAHVFNIATGAYLGASEHVLFGAATVYTAGKFGPTGDQRDWIAAATPYPDSSVHFFRPTVLADGRISFEHQTGAEISVKSGSGHPTAIVHMVSGRFDNNDRADLLIHRSEAPGPGRSISQWFVSVYTNVGAGSHQTLVNRLLPSDFQHSPANMLIPGNFDSDSYTEIALWKRAYSASQQAMYVYSIDGATTLSRLSGRTWNWTNRWWTLTQ